VNSPTYESDGSRRRKVGAACRPSYKPHFRVGADDQYLGVAFLDGDPAIVYPGDEGDATVALVYTEIGVDYSLSRAGRSSRYSRACV